MLITVSLLLNAQREFRPGCVIKNNGDSLFGNLAYQNDILMSQLCKYKSDNDTEITYYPEDISSYRFFNGKFYISKEVNQRKIFLEYLFNGIVKIYYQRDNEGDHYYIEKDTIPLTELSYMESTKYIDGKEYISEQKGFIKQLEFFMPDANGIDQRIKAIQKLEHRDLIKLADYYHSKVCADKSCIIYEKNAPLLTAFIEPLVGYLKFKDIKDANLEYGAYLNFWAPRTSERLFLRTGFIYNKLYDPQHFYYSGDDNHSWYTIPFDLYYVIGKDPTRAKIGFGYDLIMAAGHTQKSPFFPAPCIFFGLIQTVSRSTALTIEVNTKSTPIISTFSNEFRIINFSVNAGIRIKI
jgi:hypothetical protein